jgi:hypothetical protein
MRQAKERALDKGIIRIAIRLVKVCVVRLSACDAGTHKEGNTRQYGCCLAPPLLASLLRPPAPPHPILALQGLF